MKKNIVYLLILVVLGILTYVFVFTDDSATIWQANETNFTIKDTHAVTKIFITSMREPSITLTRDNYQWRLNDSFRANNATVNLLLEAFALQQTAYPVSVSEHDKVVKALSTDHAKVEVYTANIKIKTFYVGKFPAANNSTYMLMEGDKRPYVVTVPVQNIFVGIRYITQPSKWRSNQILFSANAPIEKVDVYYPDSSQYNYSVINSDTPSVSGQMQIAAPLNVSWLKNYIANFDQMYCYGFEDQFIYKDTIIARGQKLGSLQVQRKGQKPETLVIYYKPNAQDTKGYTKVNGKLYDYNVFYGLLNNKDFISIDRDAVLKMFRSYPDFFQAHDMQ